MHDVTGRLYEIHEIMFVLGVGFGIYFKVYVRQSQELLFVAA